MKFFTSDLRRNLTKILCLTLGMAMGFLLVAKVYFEQTFDSFFPDSDRIYMVTENYEYNGEYSEYDQTPGATAPGLKRYLPQVEEATRRTVFSDGGTIILEDGRKFRVDKGEMADEHFFDVFSTPILYGDPHDALQIEKQCMIPRSLAEAIGGDVIGLRFTGFGFPDDFMITIGGVYEDFPINSTIPNALYLSLPSIGLFSHDGRENWMGNDRYISYVKLSKGTDPNDMKSGIRKMLEDNIDKETLDTSHYGVSLKKLVGVYTSQGVVKTMTWMLTFLAIIMLMSAGLNYLLIVIGQMGHRSKEMAVRKCFGTANSGIFGRVMAESLFFLLTSLILAVILIYVFSDTCRELLGYTPQQLFSTKRIWIVEGIVFVFLLIVSGVVPAWLYCRTPVASAFRNRLNNRRGWKVALLALQFFATGLLMCLLVIVGGQYNRIVKTDMGFDYKNIGHLYTWKIPQENRPALIEELKRLPFIEGASSNYQRFLDGCSGNYVWVGDDVDKQINIADNYYANSDLFDVMGIEFIQGETFRDDADTVVNQVVVEKEFINVLKKISGIDEDNIVGRTFNISEHRTSSGGNEYVICGVINDIKRGGFEEESSDKRAGVWFPSTPVQFNLYLRFTDMSQENINKAQEIINNAYPDEEIYIEPFKNRVEALSMPVKKFATSVLIAGVMIMVIALIGLIGYTSDEVQRKAKEITIRKITGTSASKILKLFCVNTLKIALPSLLAGGAAAIIIGNKWLSQFSDQEPVSLVLLTLCIVCLIVILLSVVILNSLDIARSNPVNHLRSE